MQTIIFLLSFVFGTAIGSFLNVVSMRLPQDESIGGRSRCNSCKKQLRWFELVPIVSFVMQKGRCRSCGVVLSVQYPLVELGTGLLFATAALYLFSYFPLNFSLFLFVWLWACSVIAVAVAIIAADMRFQLIPDSLTACLVILAIPVVVFRAYYPMFQLIAPNLQAHAVISQWSFWASVLGDIASAAVCMLFLFCLWFFSGGKWMGFGDVKLIFATSLLVGFPAAVPALLFSFWTGALVGVVLLFLGAKTLQSKIPFGPFILLGATLAFFFSEKLLMLVTGGVLF